MRTVLILPALLLGLAACGSDPEIESGEDDTRAEGEVLGGTINDEMLPLDAVRSQPPPLVGGETDDATPDSGGTPATATSAPPGAQASSGPAIEPAEDAEPIAEDGE